MEEAGSIMHKRDENGEVSPECSEGRCGEKGVKTGETGRSVESGLFMCRQWGTDDGLLTYG